MTKLRLAFMGTPAFALPGLAALLDAGHDVAMVYCQKSRPAGRGHRLLPSPVEAFASATALPLRHPERFDEAAAADFAALDLDAAVVAAYGLILPKAILIAPRLGCLNVHASLLPRWRGAAPIERAILAGDDETGVTILQMDEGLDTGGIILAEKIAIGPEATATELREALARLGARLILAALEGRATGSLTPRPQPAEGATYAKKLRREEGRIDWRRPAAEIERAVRALNPAPGMWFNYGAERIKLLAAALAEGTAAPGTVLDAVPTIACGEGALRLLSLQRAGRAPVDGAAFLRGFALPLRTQLPCPATS
jgi:methionyl-tRNA formyltransferase